MTAVSFVYLEEFLYVLVLGELFFVVVEHRESLSLRDEVVDMSLPLVGHRLDDIDR